MDGIKYTYVYKYYGEKGGYAIITLQTDYSNGQIYNSVIVINKENHGFKKSTLVWVLFLIQEGGVSG